MWSAAVLDRHDCIINCGRASLAPLIPAANNSGANVSGAMFMPFRAARAHAIPISGPPSTRARRERRGCVNSRNQQAAIIVSLSYCHRRPASAASNTPRRRVNGLGEADSVRDEITARTTKPI